MVIFNSYVSLPESNLWWVAQFFQTSPRFPGPLLKKRHDGRGYPPEINHGHGGFFFAHFSTTFNATSSNGLWSSALGQVAYKTVFIKKNGNWTRKCVWNCQQFHRSLCLKMASKPPITTKKSKNFWFQGESPHLSRHAGRPSRFRRRLRTSEAEVNAAEMRQTMRHVMST